jgi:hypothetical protein
MVARLKVSSAPSSAPYENHTSLLFSRKSVTWTDSVSTLNLILIGLEMLKSQGPMAVPRMEYTT